MRIAFASCNTAANRLAFRDRARCTGPVETAVYGLNPVHPSSPAVPGPTRHDLGFHDAVERQARLRLAYALNQVLEAAQALPGRCRQRCCGVTQPKVSALRHYKLAGFSIERLMNLFTALDQDVEIPVFGRMPRSRKAAVCRRQTTRFAPLLCALATQLVPRVYVWAGGWSGPRFLQFFLDLVVPSADRSP